MVKIYLKKFGIVIIMFLVSIFLMTSTTMADEKEENIPEAHLPVLTTSAGQSADIMTLNILAEEAKLKYDFCDVPDVEMISSGVGLGGVEPGAGFHVEIHTDEEKYPSGTQYKTVIVAIGASLKGMGASGLSVNDELSRLENILEYCKENDIHIIGVHIGGKATRGAKGSNNEKMIDAVAPLANHLIVTSESNEDGRFTEISENNNIPMTVLDNALGLVETLEKIFNE